MSAPSQGSVAVVSDRGFFTVVAVVSAAALAFIGYILVIRGGTRDTGMDLHALPAVNAVLNATAAALLVAGRVAIARGARRFHQWCMVGAFGVSSLFLVSYLTYHWVHGDTRFAGTGVVRVAYL